MVTIILGFIGGLIGGLVFSKLTAKGANFPSTFVPNVVRKQGPSLYTTEEKKKPKRQTDEDLWLKETRQSPSKE